MNQIFFWIAFLIYTGLTIFIGFKVSKKKKEENLEQFWIGERNFSGKQMAISLAAGWLMLGWLGYGMSMIYQMGLSGVWILPLPWIILCALVIVMVPKIRKLKYFSVTEAIGEKYGSTARTMSSVVSVFVFISWTGAELFMAGTLAAPFLGISRELAMILIVLPILVYSISGGFRAIIMTDLMQFAVMALFILVLTIVAVVAANGATSGNIIGTLASTPTGYYGEGSMFKLFACGIAMPVILLIAYLPGWLVEQDLILRIQGTKSDKEAVKGAKLGFVLIGIFVIILPALTAFAALVLFPPASADSAKAIGKDATGIISAIILGHFPVWGQILMFIGLVAAQMSTVDTFSNAVSVSLGRDFLLPMAKTGSDTEKQIKISRITVGVSIVLGLIYGINAESLTDIYILSSGVLTASVAVPFLSLFLFKKVSNWGINSAIVAGSVGTILFYIMEYHVWKNVYSPAWLSGTWLGYIIVGLTCSIMALIGGTVLERQIKKT